MGGHARHRIALLGFFVVLASASCLLTSNLDGLTGKGESSSSASGSMATSGGGTHGSSGGGGSGTGAGGTMGSGGGSMVGSGGSGGTPCGAGGIGAGFPATCILDNFNRGDGLVGPAWFLNNQQAYAIQTKHLATTQYNENDAGFSNPDTILWSDIMGATQEVFVTVSSFDPQDSEIELILKSQNGAMECDAIQVDYQHGVLNGYKCENDMFVLLGAGANVTLMPGDRLGARAFPDGKVEGYVNGTLVQNWDASIFGAHASPGRIGIYSGNIFSVVEYDDFGGGGQ